MKYSEFLKTSGLTHEQVLQLSHESTLTLGKELGQMLDGWFQQQFTLAHLKISPTEEETKEMEKLSKELKKKFP